VRSLLAELARAHLVTEHSSGRYTFHDLLRAHAGEQARGLDPGAERHAAIHRMLDHYLHSAHSADRLLQPHRDPITITAPQPGVTPEHSANCGQALAWFTAEHAVLLAASIGMDTHTWQLAWTLAEFLDRRGHWHDYVATQHAALAAAQRLAKPSMQANAHRVLSRAYTHLRHGLNLFRRCGDRAG
jgi:hypothetical protein